MEGSYTKKKKVKRNKRNSKMGTLWIDGCEVTFENRKPILDVALENQIYIPHLCYHIGFPSPKGLKSVSSVYRGDKVYEGEKELEYEGCGLCIIKIEGRDGFSPSCTTLAEEGIVISTDTPDLLEKRQAHLAQILERHPHACLLCPQVRGCDRKTCSIKVPEEERCCWKFGICEIQRVADYIGIRGGLPAYRPQKEVLEDDPFFVRNYNYCIGCLRCVIACKDIAGAEALTFTNVEGEVTVGFKGRTPKEAGCKFCGICVEVCPSGALYDKEVKMVSEKETVLVPCRNACPAGVDVPRYVHLISEGKFDEANQVILKNDPFPSILGRVCHSPCEPECRRGKLDEPISIKNLKWAASLYKEEIELVPGQRTGKKVAVVGLGPSGLSCAFYLSLMGHDVVGYDALPKAGGMLRVGIPPYRLPRDVLDLELKRLQTLGVKLETGTKIESAASLLSNGYDAVFLGLGAHKGKKVEIEGGGYAMDGLGLLKLFNFTGRIEVGERVAILGGGNVAVDVARILIRENCRHVTIFYRRTKEEMPAYREEVEAALEEGVIIEFQSAPLKMEKRNGLLHIQFIKMKMSDEMDESGRRTPLPVQGSEHWLSFNNVVAAVGETPDIPEGMRSLVGEDGRIWVHNKTFMTKAERVFAGGDVVTGPRTVVEAVTAGKKAAVAIDRFLMSKGEMELTRDQGYLKPYWQFNGGRRVFPEVLCVDERLEGYPEVISVLGEEAAKEEAKRCMRCYFRFMIPEVTYPPEKWMPFVEENVLNVPEEEGVYQLFDEEKKLYKVFGTENLRKAIIDELHYGGSARFFIYEKEVMYTSRERQIIQQYLKENGKLPPGNDEMEELF